MSISDQSTDRSSDCVELIGSGCLTYSFVLGRDDSLVSEMLNSDSEMEYFKQEFLDHFPESHQSNVTFFSMVPTLSDGEELKPLYCFQTATAIYVRAGSKVPKSTFDQLLDLATKSGLETIYIAVYKELETFMRTAKMLMYMGFRQLDLETQKKLCHTSALLLALTV